MTLKFTAAGQAVSLPVADLAEGSAAYNLYRKESGLGASHLSGGRVFSGRALVARVSYNGNVWRPEGWKPGAEPLLRVGGLFA